MATNKAINEAFLTTAIKNDIEIEKATKRNISRITRTNREEIHSNLLKVFNIKSIDDSKYFLFEEFKNLIKSIRDKKEADREKKEHTNTHTNTSKISTADINSKF